MRKPAQADSSSTTDAERAGYLPWLAAIKPDENGMYRVYAYEWDAKQKKDIEITVALCPSREMALLVRSCRNIAEAGTNLIGHIRDTIKKIEDGPHAEKYNEAWKYSGRVKPSWKETR